MQRPGRDDGPGIAPLEATRKASQKVPGLGAQVAWGWALQQPPGEKLPPQDSGPVKTSALGPRPGEVSPLIFNVSFHVSGSPPPCTPASRNQLRRQTWLCAV